MHLSACPVRRSLVAGLLSVSITGALAGDLHQLAVAAGKLYFGTAIDNSELDDSTYKAIISDAKEYGQITPGNGQKWAYTEKSRGVFTYDSGDEISDLAAANGQLLRCHTLVWYSQLPSWVSSGTWTVDTLREVINTHIENEVGHYKGLCYAWDVVNEAISDSGTYRDSVFYKVLGTDYLPIAFNAAAAADPGAKLYYNDYNIESAGAKHTLALEIVDIIQAAGAPIDGVGLQGHFIVGSTPTEAALRSALEEFVAKGLEVAYTEVDVRFSNLPATDSGYAQQATDYGNVMSACLNVAKCVGVTVWGASDKYSWIPSTFPGQGEACILADDMSTKPAYDKIREVLAAAAGTGVVTSSSAAPTTSTTADASSSTASSSTKAAATTTSTKAAATTSTTKAAATSTRRRQASSSSRAAVTTIRRCGKNKTHPTTTSDSSSSKPTTRRTARKAREH